MFIFVMSFSVNIVSWNDKSECIKTSFFVKTWEIVSMNNRWMPLFDVVCVLKLM